MQARQSSSASSRLLKAALYLTTGVLLTTVVPFYFSPWYFQSWIHFGILLAWAMAGAVWDPFRFGQPPPNQVQAGISFRRRLALIVLALLLLAPFIFWVANLDWFFPWLPWRSLAYRWVVREIVLVSLLAAVVPMIWPALAFGRQLCLFVGLLLTSHLFLLLACAGMSGGPDYLQDGETQDCFLSQLQFKLVTGTFVFVILRLGLWKFHAGRLRVTTLVWTTLLTLAVALAVGVLGILRKHAQDGPVMKGKPVGQWITEASPVPDATDPSVLALHEIGTAAFPQLMKALKEGRSQFYWFGSLSEPTPSDIRTRAGQLLKSFRHQAAPVVPELLECLESKDNQVRKLATEILGTAGLSNEQVRKVLLNALSDSECQYEATLALSSLGRNDPKIVADLAELAKADTDGAPYWATVTLAKLGPRAKPALPVLIDLANNPQSKSRQDAIRGIALMTPESQAAIPALLKALDSQDSWLRKCAVIALGRIGPPAQAAVPRLRQMVDKEDDYTKIDIARTLWRIDSNQFALAAPLAQSLVAAKLENACHTGNFGNDVTSALDLLGEMGTNARSVSPRLREGLRANDALLRFSVAWASCRIAPEEKQLAMQTLQDLVRPGKARARGSNDSFVRAREREAHGQREYFAGLAAAGALWQLQPDRRPELQRLILLLLEEWEQWAAYEFPSDEQVLIPPLNEILKDPAAPAAHPLAGSVLAEISGSAGERW